MKTDLQQTIFYSTYSRWNPELNRRETWGETVDRVMTFMEATLSAHKVKIGTTEQIIDLERLRNAMLNMEVMPSMRIVQMAGPALERCNVGAYNCLPGYTKIVTDLGLRKLSDIAGTTVNVRTVDGQWRPAEIKSFGKQPTQAISFIHGAKGKRGNIVHIVNATPNHRWMLKDGSITTELKVGDVLVESPKIDSRPYDDSVRHGFVFGDGTISYNKQGNGFAQVRLCGKKNELAESLFGMFPQSHPPSAEGDTYVYLGKDRVVWKELPSQTDANYVQGFIEGWILADGSWSGNTSVSISTQNEDAALWLRANAGLAGFTVTSYVSYQDAANFGYRSGRLHVIRLARGGNSSLTMVAEIKPTEAQQEVFCPVEPVTGTFMLGTGQITGNCSYLPIVDWECFGELLYILMQGTGVGFSVEQQYIKQLPEIAHQQAKPIYMFHIEDTTEGWCDALVYGLRTWASGLDVEFDYSKIRPYGAPLATKGGKASGPEPLKQLLNFAKKLILHHQGRKLSSLNVHDLACYCGSIVQVGGIRRAAEISLSNLNDIRMREAKDGQFWLKAPERAMANNSAVYNERPTIMEFTSEWVSLMKSGSGERGIFNREAVNIGRPSRRLSRNDWGINPCFAKGTLIETVNGQIAIEDLTTNTWVYTMEADETLGIRRASASWKNKVSETLTIAVGNYKLSVTPDHLIYSELRGWVKAKELFVGEEVVAIQRVRRGAAYSGIKLSSEIDHRMEHRFVWEKMYGPLPVDWDVHHENGNTYDNRLSNLRAMPHAHHAYVTSLEQPNDHQVRGRGNKFVTHAGSKLGRRVIVPLPEKFKAGLHQYATIKSIEPGPTVDVYDLKVEGTHNVIANGIVAHNCGEIILRPFEFCNLSIAVARPEDTFLSMERKVRLAAQFGIIQSLLTNFRYIRPEWKKNCEEERLLGVDITGQMDNYMFHRQSAPLYTAMRVAVLDEVEKLSKALDIPMPAATTCVKPSGNSSQLLNTSSGIHPRFAPFYVRRVRISAMNPVAKLLISSGVPHFPEVGQPPDKPTIWVFEFPVKSPEGAVCRENTNAIRQLEQWKECKISYTEHNPSCTIFVQESEWLEVGAWVYKNWDYVGGISFMPYDGGVYDLAPYEQCDEEEYNKRVAAWPVIDFKSLPEFETSDNTEMNREFSCHGDKCEI